MKQLFEDFKSALGFITILPAGKNVAWSPLGMIKFFPVIGLILGSLLLFFDLVVSYFWPPLAAAVLDTVFLICLTGAFHLDGLGDAADGLFSHGPKKRVMEIMKDSRIGMMALVAVVCVLALKVVGIYSMKEAGVSGLLFLIIPAYARGSMLFGIRFLKYGRKDTGTGLDLFEEPLGWRDFSFLLIPVAVSFLMGFSGLWVVVVFALATTGILLFYKNKLNCITGDMLGAMTEMVEAILFLAAGITLI